MSRVFTRITAVALAVGTAAMLSAPAASAQAASGQTPRAQTQSGSQTGGGTEKSAMPSQSRGTSADVKTSGSAGTTGTVSGALSATASSIPDVCARLQEDAARLQDCFDDYWEKQR